MLHKLVVQNLLKAELRIDMNPMAEPLTKAQLVGRTAPDPIKTTRLLLRRIVESDVDALFAIYGDPATNTFNPAGPLREHSGAVVMLARWDDHWHAHGHGNWALSLHESPDAVIGFGGLAFRQFSVGERANLGYRFATTAWGRGLATEFCDAALRFGFEVLNLPEIWATVRENHQASRRVLEKSGLVSFDYVPDPRGVPGSVLYAVNRIPWQTALRQ